MDREKAHQLLDRLDPAQLDAVATLLEVMVPRRGPQGTNCRRPQRRRRRRDHFRQSPEGGIPFEQVVAECGLTMEQVRHQWASKSLGESGFRRTIGDAPASVSIC